MSSTNTPPSNRVLKNLCEAFLLEVESGRVCRLHSEKLKLFCLDHRTPICVVCRDSNIHRNHTFTPINEAAELLRNDLLGYQKALQEKVKVFNDMKRNWEETLQEICFQAVDTERKIRCEFKMLHEFLQIQERERICALKDEGELKKKRMRNLIGGLSRELNTLESTLKTIEEGLKEEDASLLLKVDTLTREAQRPLPDAPVQVTGALINVAEYLANVRFDVWYKLKDVVTYTPVILDPNTAHRELQLSDNLTSVSCGPKWPLILLHQRAQPERMAQHRSVLGSVGFSSGSHCWDVQIGDNPVWALGVIAQNAQMKGDIVSGLWMMRFCHGKVTAFSPSCPLAVLPLKGAFQRVRVHLDWDGGKLSFIDPSTDTVLHTFTHRFRDRMFPYINTWNGQPLSILPLKVSVTVG